MTHVLPEAISIVVLDHLGTDVSMNEVNECSRHALSIILQRPCESECGLSCVCIYLYPYVFVTFVCRIAQPVKYYKKFLVGFQKKFNYI